MFDAIQIELNILDKLKEYNITSDFLVERKSKYYSLLSLVKKNYPLKELYSKVLKYNDLKGNKISPQIFSYSWIGVRITPKTTNEEKNDLYDTVSSFLSEFSIFPSHSIIVENSREINILYLNGRSKIIIQSQQSYREKILKLRDFLDQIEPISTFNYKLERSTYRVKNNFTLGDSEEIFNDIIPNDYLPFSVLNRDLMDNKRKGTRVSENRVFKINKNPNKPYAISQEWIENSNKALTIQMYLFTREDIGDLYSNKNSYSNVEYNFATNEILIDDYPNRKSEKLSVSIERLRNSFNSFKIGSSSIYEVEGSFALKDYDLDETIFLDMIINNPILRNFFYFDESQNILAQKKRFGFHFVLGSNHIGITVSPQRAKGSELFYTNDGVRKFKEGEPYYEFKIIYTRNKEYAEWISNVLRKLLRFYLDYNEEVISEYKEVIKNFNAEPFTEYTPSKLEIPSYQDSSMSKLKKLSFANPELFIPGYATGCQPKSQPTVIPESEVDYFKSIGKQVVKFPEKISNGINFPFVTSNYFVSLNPSTPFVVLKQNTLPNCDKFPYTICTHSKKELEIDPDTWEITIISKQKKNKEKSHILDVNKFIGYDRKGVLRQRLKFLLGSSLYMRIGTPNSNLSIIHAIAYAIDHENYISHDDKEQYAREVRDNISDSVNFNLAKQENYDLSPSQIKERFLSDTEIITYERYFRLLEEFFEINLFAFSSNEKDSVLVIPRYKDFHIHNYKLNDRPTILVYEYRTDEGKSCISEREVSIHYELIVKIGKKEEVIYEDYSTILDFMKKTTKVINPHFNNGIKIDIQDDINVMKKYNFLSSSKWKIVSQFIDGAGKVRALTYGYSEMKISIYTPFLVPMNYPIEDLTDTDQKTIDTFSKDNNLDIKDGIFMFKGSIFKVYKEKRELSLIEQLRVIEKQANILKQLILLLFSLTDEDYITFGKRFIIDNNVKYNIDNIKRKFPLFNDYTSAYQYFSPFIPSLFYQNKIVLETEKLKEGIIHYLKVTPKRLFNEFSGFFKVPSDFNIYSPYQMIFTNENSLIKTLIFKDRDKDVSNIFYFSIEPYFVKLGNYTYLVQYVLEGDKERAISVIYHWYTKMINPGFYVKPLNLNYDVNITEDVYSYPKLPEKTVYKFQDSYIAILPLNLMLQ